MAAHILDTPYAPARVAFQALSPARQPGHAANEATVLIQHIIGRVDALTVAGEPVPAAEADELSAQIQRVIELVCPLAAASGRDDDPVRRFNLHVRAWAENTARLLVAHLDM